MDLVDFSPTSTSAVNWADAWDDLDHDEWQEGLAAPVIELPCGSDDEVIGLPPVIGLPGGYDGGSAGSSGDEGDGAIPMPVVLPPGFEGLEEDDHLSPLPPKTEVKLYQSGGRYEGPLVDGMPHGDYGVFYYPIGHRYAGSWRNGEKHGAHGVFYFANGARFEGRWEHNMRSGHGTQYDQNGQWQRCEYVENRVARLLARGIGGDADAYLRSLPQVPSDTPTTTTTTQIPLVQLSAR